MLLNLIRKLKYQYKLSKYTKTKNNFIKSDSPLQNDLDQNGITFIKNFDQINNFAAQIQEKYKNLDQKFLENFIKKKIKYDHPQHTYKIMATELFDKDMLTNYANHEFFKENISNYFGFDPFLQYIMVWFDIPNNNLSETVSTQIFHRDSDDIKLIKTFYYLNDVDENNGPFQFIKKSHKTPYIHLKSKKDLEFNKVIIKQYGENSVYTAKGSKNSLFMADTNGYHRGLKLKKGLRALVTAMYTSQTPTWGKSKNKFLP